jgi:hypothetical protein
MINLNKQKDSKLLLLKNEEILEKSKNKVSERLKYVKNTSESIYYFDSKLLFWNDFDTQKTT